MRQPLARTKCVGRSPPRAPNSASGRLLPVDAPPGMIAAARGRHTFSSGRSKSIVVMASIKNAAAAASVKSAGAARSSDADHLDRHGTQQLDLSRIRRGAEGERPKRAQHELLVPRLEELDRDQRALHVGEEALELLAGGRRGILPRGAPLASMRGRGSTQLVHGDERGLREVQRRVVGGRDRDDDVRAIERLVVEPAILTSEEHRHIAVRRALDQLLGGAPRLRHTAFCGAMPGGERRDADAALERLVDGLAVANLGDDILAVVRDEPDPRCVVRRGSDQGQRREAHVLHCADDGRDVDGILRLVQHDANARERISHVRRRAGGNARGIGDRPGDRSTHRRR